MSDTQSAVPSGESAQTAEPSVFAEVTGSGPCGDGFVVLCQPVRAEYIDQAQGSADAIHLALQLGRLDLLTIFLGILALLLGIGAFAGFWVIRHAAREAAITATPEALRDHMKNSGSALIRSALEDPQVVAKFHFELERLGLVDAEDADLVDNDAEEKETDNA